jgi:hypothetical protein
MGIFGALSNPEVQERLVRLVRKLDQIEASETAPRRTHAGRRLRVGVVPEAIMRVLAAAEGPMRMRDVHVEVEGQLGQSVPRSTVKNWLAEHARGERTPLVRLGRGRYRLAG